MSNLIIHWAVEFVWPLLLLTKTCAPDRRRFCSTCVLSVWKRRRVSVWTQRPLLVIRRKGPSQDRLTQSVLLQAVVSVNRCSPSFSQNFIIVCYLTRWQLLRSYSVGEMNEWVWSVGGMLLTGVMQATWEKTWLSASHSTTNYIRTGLEASPGLRSEVHPTVVLQLSGHWSTETFVRYIILLNAGNFPVAKENTKKCTFFSTIWSAPHVMTLKFEMFLCKKYMWMYITFAPKSRFRASSNELDGISTDHSSKRWGITPNMKTGHCADDRVFRYD